MTSCYNIQQNTDRTDRAIDNMVICRTFLRSILTVIIIRIGDLSPASHSSDRESNERDRRYCGSSWASTCPRSVRSVF